ncbi:alpha/beta hydrolase [Marivita sp. S6314]|uniref:alpha/beta hydrolase n=1 Tax=Marivita sp. S6314 TaxID=2926406 RepID=UPI001FF6E160|nr:alpha/beta hydrolase [Marivita sp. S6314]MCK0149459.1 alpha/beta hydrolase [Marivita sp. S6314]
MSTPARGILSWQATSCGVGWALMVGLWLTMAPDGGWAASDDTQRGVSYLTQRDRSGSPDPETFYNGERGAEIAAGFCAIEDQSLDFLSSVAEAAPFRIPDEILKLHSVQESDVRTVFDGLVASSAGAAPTLYTHGFFIDFEKGCRRATVFQENANLVGRFLWFSWPSNGELTNYTHDEADLHWSVPDLANAIARLDATFGKGQFNIAGHSMGGRGMALALYDVAVRHPDVRVGHVALLAPDIDFGLFARLVPRIRPIVKSLTIYVAEADRPLALSEQVHGYPRLGQAGNDVGVLDGVEVIDLSDLPVRSPSGHLYHIYNTEVGDDLNQLLNSDLLAGDRRNLVRTGDNLWRLQRQDDQ